MSMEWSIMPRLPSWLTPLPPPPPLETLKALPATVDYSQLKPLPPFDSIPFQPLRSDSLVMGTQRDEAPFTSWPEEATELSMQPLEELLMNLRRYNRLLPEPEDSESSPVVDEAASDEEESRQQESEDTRPLIDCHEGDTKQEESDPLLSNEKKKRIRRRHYVKQHARISRKIKQYATESKPGRVAYEARFAMRNGMWKRRIPIPPIQLPNAPSSVPETMSSNGHIAPPSRRALIDYSPPPELRRSSPICRGSSPMSICSVPEHPTSPSPAIPFSLTLRPHLCDRTPPKLPSPPLTAQSSPISWRRTKFVDSHPAPQIPDGTMRERIQPTLDMMFRGGSSGSTSLSSTPRARPSELEPRCYSLNTPVSTLAAQSPTISTLQLNLHPQPRSPNIHLAGDDSPIPGLTFETLPEVHTEDSTVQATIPHDTLLFDALLHYSVEENLRTGSPSPNIHGPSEEPPPTALDKNETAVRSNHSLNSLFDGELSDEETAQNSSLDSSSRSESPPSPISIRLIIPPRPNHLRNMNQQQLLTPSLSPGPLSADALWFCGPRPFASIQTSTAVLTKIEEQEEAARLRPRTVVSGIISRIRREMRVTGGGSLGGQTQLILSNPLGSRAGHDPLAGIDKNALQRNTELVLRAVNEHRAKE